ncbi:MAG TPA: YceI family protein [Candidatus Dormibacteraeota bacterium]
MNSGRWWGRAAIACCTVLVVVAGAFMLFRVTAPSRLSLPNPSRPTSSSASPSAPSDPLLQACVVPRQRTAGRSPAGLWMIATGSQAGYRAREKWAQLPSPHEAVARTDRVAGWLSVGGEGAAWRVEGGCFAVDLRELQSVDTVPGQTMSDRDENVRGFLDTDHHPTARYVPHPIGLLEAFVNGQVTRMDIPGDIEVKGIRRPATANIEIRYDGESTSVAGSLPVIAEDHGIELPKAADFVSVDSRIVVEFALVLRRLE